MTPHDVLENQRQRNVSDSDSLLPTTSVNRRLPTSECSKELCEMPKGEKS